MVVFSMASVYYLKGRNTAIMASGQNSQKQRKSVLSNLAFIIWRNIFKHLETLHTWKFRLRCLVGWRTIRTIRTIAIAYSVAAWFQATAAAFWGCCWSAEYHRRMNLRLNQCTVTAAAGVGETAATCHLKWVSVCRVFTWSMVAVLEWELE